MKYVYHYHGELYWPEQMDVDGIFETEKPCLTMERYREIKMAILAGDGKYEHFTISSLTLLHTIA